MIYYKTIPAGNGNLKKIIFFKYRVTDRVYLLQSSKRFQRFFSRLQPNEGLPIACSMGS